MAPRKQTAKNAANQAALDRLAERYQTNMNKGSDRYGQTLHRAMSSLASHKEAITTYQQALDLKYVGDHCARIICPPNTASAGHRLGGGSPSSVSSSNSNSGRKAYNNNNKKRKAATTTTTTKTKSTYQPPKKQALYQDAKLRSNDWKVHQHSLSWKVILIIDGREHESDHVIAKCLMSGIPSEERNLPIGDMAWIVQGRKAGTIVTELMLGTIIERKTPEDLKSSIHGTRYLEQRLRLVNSGLPQLLYLIEGNMQKDLYRCPSDTMHSAVWETRLQYGFSILQTPNIEGTVRQLKRMHRRILQRTFPSAFQNTLPVFHEGFSRHDSSNPNRRRPASLEGMTFDGPPVPPFGTDFVSYEELKAKIECDRELANRRVANIHLKFLKQVCNVSDIKCQAIAAQYPTPKSLITGFSEKFLADLPTANLSTRQTTIGPKTALELQHAYGGYQGVIPKTTREPVSKPSAPPAGSATAVAVAKPKPPPANNPYSAAVNNNNNKKPPPAANNKSSVAPCDKQPPPKRRLGDSIGSLLSSTDDDMTPHKRTLKTPPSSDHRKAPPLRAVTIDLLDSSDEEDDNSAANAHTAPPARTKTSAPVVDNQRHSANGESSSEDELCSLRDRLNARGHEVIEID